MKIRVLKGFNGYRVGQVFNWGDGMARVFLQLGASLWFLRSKQLAFAGGGQHK